jgi:hypothetical protein
MLCESNLDAYFALGKEFRHNLSGRSLALKLKIQPRPKESAEANTMTMEIDGFSYESPRGTFHLREQFHQLISRPKNYLSMHEPKRSAMGIST